jgi:hypothetical protein
MSKQKKTFKPGETAPSSGEYKAPKEDPKTCKKGKPLPPTKEPGKRYKKLPEK